MSVLAILPPALSQRDDLGQKVKQSEQMTHHGDSLDDIFLKNIIQNQEAFGNIRLIPVHNQKIDTESVEAETLSNTLRQSRRHHLQGQGNSIGKEDSFLTKQLLENKLLQRYGQQETRGLGEEATTPNGGKHVLGKGEQKMAKVLPFLRSKAYGTMPLQTAFSSKTEQFVDHRLIEAHRQMQKQDGIKRFQDQGNSDSLLRLKSLIESSNSTKGPNHSRQSPSQDNSTFLAKGFFNGTPTQNLSHFNQLSETPLTAMNYGDSLYITNSDQLIEKISQYIGQRSVGNMREVDLNVDHKEIGKFQTQYYPRFGKRRGSTHDHGDESGGS